MRRLIMIGGVHGVGKSFLSNELANYFKIRSYTASQLMKNYIGSNVDNHKKVSDINLNQDVLQKAIKCYVPEDIPFILDGHFCLLNQYNKITTIPLETYKNIGINAIVVVTDDSSSIIKRLYTRDGMQYTEEFIDNFQNNEISYAKEIAKYLGIDFLLHRKSDDKINLYRYIEKQLR